MSVRHLSLALTFAAGLCGCASADAPGQIAWAPRADANLAADKAACQRTASELDMNSPKEYTDGRYGVAAALASRVDQASLRGGAEARMRQAVFEDCDIVSRDRRSRTNNGYVTAPSTHVSQPHGFLFVRSRLTKEHPAMAPASVVLGRPWHPFADPEAVGSAVFVDCWMDDHITAAGWDRMSSVDSATQVRYWFEPALARFYEAGSTGPGAVASPTRRVLGPGDRRTYTIARTLGDWTPDVAPRK